MNKNFGLYLFLVAIPVVGWFGYNSLPEEDAIALMGNGLFWVSLALIVFIIWSVMSIFKTLNRLQDSFLKQEAGEDAVETTSWWATIYDKLTDAVPVERESEVTTDHNYDGIVELDNNLPPWWLYGFYATIIFAGVYLVRAYVTGDMLSQEEEYAEEMRLGEEEVAAYRATAKDFVDETTVEVSTDEDILANGKAVYEANCVACHMADGGGGIGPNLADEYWIHGADIKDIFSTIKYGGAPGKGMVAWQNEISAGDIADLSSYILSFQGTTPANPKEPEGDFYGAEEEPAPIEEEASTEE